MRPLRYCMVTTFYPPFSFGGDAIGVQRLARALTRRGCEVTVVHDADAFNLLAASPNPTPAPDDGGVEVISLRSKTGPVSPFLTQQFGRPVVNGRYLRRFMHERQFDVIWFHNISLVGGPGILAVGGVPRQGC